MLQYTGLSNFSEYRWWKVGYAKLQAWPMRNLAPVRLRVCSWLLASGLSVVQGEDLNYFGIQGLRIAGGQGILIICVCQVRCSLRLDSASVCASRASSPDARCRSCSCLGPSMHAAVALLPWSPLASTCQGTRTIQVRLLLGMPHLAAWRHA